MKCPIRRWAFDVEAQQLIPEQLDCLKGECAWWAHDSEMCCILDICADIEGINETLMVLVDKMPHEEQFRK